MKSKLNLIATRDMSQEDWLRYRHRGIGASEVGTILGVNPYKCSAQLFYEKLGETTLNLENMAMFLGKEQEPFIATLWEYWDPADPCEDTMIKNYREGRKVRRCQRVNAYVNNPDFPWLFVSLDRKINKDQSRVAYLGSNADEGSLELKTIAGYEADKWESGIPPGHVIQVQTQLLVCEFPFGELAVLQDGRRFDVLPFEQNLNVQETIIRETKKFWDRVEQGRVTMTQRFEAERNYNHALVDELNAQLSEIEPPPDGSEAFAKYLKERYKIAEPGEMTGTDEMMAIAVAHKAIGEQIKQLETPRREFENQLKNVLRDGADKLTFGDRGYVSWKADTNGARRFNNKVKV
jgi:putative phage-type endonuclease